MTPLVLVLLAVTVAVGIPLLLAFCCFPPYPEIMLAISGGINCVVLIVCGLGWLVVLGMYLQTLGRGL